MKSIALMALMSFLVLSGFALASQSGEQKGGSTVMPEQKGGAPMMEEMMKGGKEGEHMGGMMGMMKMMDQCASMMESMRSKADRTKESQQK